MSVTDPTLCRTSRRPDEALATGILIFAAFMDLVDVTIVNVALPSIRGDLHATPAHLEWVLSGYTLTFAVLLITGGRLGDNFGRRTMFLVGVGGFTLASLAACLAGNGEVLLVARVVQGALRGDDGAADALQRAGALRTARARRGVRRRRRGQRYGGRDRPAARRLADHPRRVRDRLAQHLPDQRARSAWCIFVLAWMFVPNTSSATAQEGRPARRAAGQRRRCSSWCSR